MNGTMVLITFDDRTVADVALLSSLKSDYVAQMLKLSLDFLLNGGKKKVFAAAARTIGVDAEQVESAASVLDTRALRHTRQSRPAPPFLRGGGDASGVPGVHARSPLLPPPNR